VVGTHHQLVVGGRPHPLKAALIVAEGMAEEIDREVAGPFETEAGLDGNPAELFASACLALGLEGEALARARAEAGEVARALFAWSPTLAAGADG